MNPNTFMGSVGPPPSLPGSSSSAGPSGNSPVGGGSSTVVSGGGVGGAMQNERVVVRRAGRSAIREFLRAHNCFSILRTSGKVVVFDTRIPIQLAFYALVEHGESVQ